MTIFNTYHILFYLCLIFNLHKCYDSNNNATIPNKNTPSERQEAILFNYEFKKFDTKKNSCIKINSFKYKSNRELKFINFNDDDYENLKFRQLVAVKDDSKLILLLFDIEHNKDNSYKEYLIKEFDSKIILVEPKWLFNRLYVLTQKNFTYGIYEIDLYYRIVSLLDTFTTNSQSPILITSDPFQGTLTYSIENKLFITNIIYLNLNETYLKQLGSDESVVFTETQYENLMSDFGTCEKYDFFDYIVTSSQIEGYDKMQTFYIKTKSNKLQNIICSIFNHECNCVPLSNKPIQNKDTYLNVYKYSNIKTCSNEDKNDAQRDMSHIKIHNKNSYQNMTIHETIKDCLRICPLAEWKKDLIKSTNSNFNPNSIYNDLSCANHLKLSTSLEQFGIGLIPSAESSDPETDMTNVRVLIHYYPEFMNQLLPKCNEFEMMYKYLISYRKVDDILVINKNFETSFFNQSSSIDSTIYLTVETKSKYEISVNIQTPFDARPYHIGSYLVNNNIQIDAEFLEPNYKKMIIKENLFLYSNYWSEYISNNFIIASFYKEYKDSIMDNFDSIYYLLYDLKTNSSVYKKIGQVFNADNNNKFQQILFKIENLNEDNAYRLRLIDRTDPDEVSSLSNMITFRTLKRPTIELINTDDQSIELEINLTCRIQVNDHDLNNPQIYQENGCNAFRVYFKENVDNATFSSLNESNWQMKFEYLLFDKDFQTTKSNELDNDNFRSLIVKRIKITSLTPETNFSIKIDLELYSLTGTTSGVNILTTDILNVKTSQKIEKPDDETHYKAIKVFLFISLLCSILVMSLMIRLIYKGYKKRIQKNRFKKIFEKNSNNLSFETMSFLDKMNINILYSPKIQEKKFFLENLKKLPKIEESKISIIKKIGNGAFGEVFNGILRDSKNNEAQIAIKKLKKDVDFTEKLDLITEAISLNSLKSPNLISFYGICMESNNIDELSPKYLIFEYMNMGDLLSYLRLVKRNNKNFKDKTSVSIAIEIAKGCEYLEKMQIIHRDLAARNCLVNIENKDELYACKDDPDPRLKITVKIGDFGLSKEIYVHDYYRQVNNQKPLPIRWLSPESLLDGIFTTRSDVWSFGVVLYEIVTLGNQPYIGMDNQQVISYIKSGGLLEMPSKCPSDLREIAENCWRIDYNSRPSFETILKSLVSIYNEPNGLYKNLDFYQVFLDIYGKEKYYVAKPAESLFYEDNELSSNSKISKNLQNDRIKLKNLLGKNSDDLESMFKLNSNN